MSIFKTSGFVIKITKIKEKEFIYTIFSKDYWKIRANKKIWKDKALDLWYIANFEIETKENRDIHKIKNIIIKSEFLNKKRNFSEINNYLLILATILKKTPNWEINYDIYNIIEEININENINEIKLILLRLKIISILWELNENHSNNTIKKILKFININNIKDILRLNGINIELKKELDLII